MPLALLLALSATSPACSDSEQAKDKGGEIDGNANGPGKDAQVGLDSGDGAADDAGGGNGSDAGAGSGDAGPVGNGQAEVCDGKDNDMNGIVDDVDVAGDGVCDCLNIATIGEIGPWSEGGGNVFKTWLDSRSPRPATELGDQVLTDELLARYQVIVILYAGTLRFNGYYGPTLLAHHTFSPDEVAAFQRWVTRGGGVMTTAGYTGDEAAEVANVNRLLAPMGAAYSTSRRDLYDYVTNWTAHPLTDGVMRINTDNGVEPDGPMGMSIAFDGSGRVALQVTQADQGRIAVWGDEWMTYDSEWADITDQQVSRFWLNILKWLSPSKICQVELPPLL